MSEQASDPALRGVLETLTVIVIDPSSSSRASVRKALTDLGVGFDNVHMVDNYRIATKTLSAKQADIVLLEYDGEWGEALGVLSRYRQSCEWAPNAALFFTARGTDEYVKSVAARDDVSGLFFKPYTYAYLSRQLAEAVRNRGDRDLYQTLLNEGRLLLWKGDEEGARGRFERARAVAHAEVQAHAYLGELELKRNPLLAAKLFTEALRIDPSDYRCLTGNVRALIALKKYREAYVFHEKTLRNFPVIPTRLPELIRLSMLIGKSEDVLGYFDIYSRTGTGESEIRKPLASALIVHGKKLLSARKAGDARAVFEKAHALCRGQDSMLVEICTAMLKGGLGEDARRMLAGEPTGVRENPDILLAEFEYMREFVSPERVVLDGTDLLRRGVKSAGVYEAVITSSRTLKRRDGLIEELINSAIADYPEEAERFERLRTPT